MRPEPAVDFLEPLAVALFMGAVMLLAALHQRRELRRRGEAPATTVGAALLYAAGAFLSGVAAQLWNPPGWQKALVVGAGLLLVHLLLRRFRSRLPRWLARFDRPAHGTGKPPGPAYQRGLALARRLRRLFGRD